MQEVIVRKHVKVYTIDALKLALEVGSPKYVSTIMQTCFFKLANIIPADEAIGYIKSGIEKKFKKKGDDVVKENQACVDQALAMLKEVEVPASLDGVAAYEPKALITEDMGTFANTLMKPILHQKGDDIPVSAMSYDGSMPTATSKFEKRGIAPSVPKWDSAACIQCNQCVMACPHAAIRSKLIEPANLAGSAGLLQYRRREAAGQEGARSQVPSAGLHRRLHRLRRLCRDLPGQGEGDPPDPHAGRACPPARTRTSNSSSRCRTMSWAAPMRRPSRVRSS